MTKIVDMGNYEMHHPTEKLKGKVSNDGALSMEEIEKRVAQNMEKLTAEFLKGLSESIITVNGALTALGSREARPEDQDTIFRHAHDMKGMGGSFGYPIVGMIGTALSDLTDEKTKLAALNIPLIKAHMDVLRWIVDQKIKTEEDPRAAPLLAALEEAKSKL
ncbi:MAG: Hpt domain-containing protein [Sneathiella sp.]|nr:Hpt domain-containing protein [Sneathiella sp.]